MVTTKRTAKLRAAALAVPPQPGRVHNEVSDPGIKSPNGIACGSAREMAFARA